MLVARSTRVAISAVHFPQRCSTQPPTAFIAAAERISGVALSAGLRPTTEQLACRCVSMNVPVGLMVGCGWRSHTLAQTNRGPDQPPVGKSPVPSPGAFSATPGGTRQGLRIDTRRVTTTCCAAFGGSARAGREAMSTRGLLPGRWPPNHRPRPPRVFARRYQQ